VKRNGSVCISSTVMFVYHIDSTTLADGHVVVLQTYVLHIECAYGPTVACGGTDPRVEMKGKRLLRNDHWMFQACELGLPLQV
jgi:hypothetical protein